MHKLQSAQNALTRVVLPSLRHLSASERLSYLHWHLYRCHKDSNPKWFFCCFPSVTFEPLHYLLNFSSFTLIFAFFLSYAGVELLSVSLQGFTVECTNSRISHIWLCCDIFAFFGQKLDAMAMSLRPCNQKCLLWIGRPRKPPVISNHILAISCRDSFMCNYSNFCPKIGCHGNAPLFLVFVWSIAKIPCYK